jgi:fluoride ion exporter CrcB/FEX
MRVFRFFCRLWDSIREDIFEIIGVITGITTFIILRHDIPKLAHESGLIFAIVIYLIVSAILGLITSVVFPFLYFICKYTYNAVTNAWRKSKPGSDEIRSK